MIELNKKAEKRMQEYAKKAGDQEIGGLLLGKKFVDGHFEVKDAIILKQHRNGTTFCIDDDAMMDFTKNASDKELESVIGWWHSHAKMDTFYSTDDDATFKRLAEFSGFNACVGVVVNLAKQEHWRVMVLTKGGTFVDIDNVMPKKEEELETVITVVDTSDFKDKVIDDYKGYYSNQGAHDLCPTCDGEGWVKMKNGKPTKIKKRSLPILGDIIYDDSDRYTKYDRDNNFW